MFDNPRRNGFLEEMDSARASRSFSRYREVSIRSSDYHNLGVIAEAYERSVDDVAGDAAQCYVVDEVMSAYLTLKCASRPNHSISEYQLSRARRLVEAVRNLDELAQRSVRERAIREGYITDGGSQ